MTSQGMTCSSCEARRVWIYPKQKGYWNPIIPRERTVLDHRKPSSGPGSSPLASSGPRIFLDASLAALCSHHIRGIVALSCLMVSFGHLIHQLKHRWEEGPSVDEGCVLRLIGKRPSSMACRNAEHGNVLQLHRPEMLANPVEDNSSRWIGPSRLGKGLVIERRPWWLY